MSILQNPVFVSVLISWIVAQSVKTVINGLITKTIHSVHEFFACLLWQTGGMPSSHSSMIAALVISIGMYEGTDSTVFILSLVLAIVVIRDALGVRLASGLQARALNKLGKRLKEQLEVDFTSVKEVQGHTFVEVLAGIIIGCLITLTVSVVI